MVLKIKVALNDHYQFSRFPPPPHCFWCHRTVRTDTFSTRA